MLLETLSGLGTIRAYQLENDFMNSFYTKLNLSNTVTYYNIATKRWLEFFFIIFHYFLFLLIHIKNNKFLIF